MTSPSTHAFALIVLVALACASACGREDVAVDDQSSHDDLSFAVWCAADAPEDAATLMELLQSAGGVSVRQFPTPEAWMASDADVLLVRGSVRTGTPGGGPEEFIDEHDFLPLKKRRVIGIGYEGGRIFSALRLDIRGDYCMSFRETAPRIRVEGGLTDQAGLSQAEMLAFDAARLSEGPAQWDCLGLYLPKAGEAVQQVEVLARWGSAPHHCPLARQGNMIFCGISADARTWTPEFSTVFQQAAISLAKSPLAPFRLSEWETTPPGELTFRLAGGAQTAVPHDRSFFFKFPEPVLFSAELEMTDGGVVAMFFNGQATHRAARRVDARTGESLNILLPVTRRDLAANEDRYWELRVTNFEDRTHAACTLRIRYDTNAVVELPRGLNVPLQDPPQDEATIETLIELVASDDAVSSAKAKAALLIVGEPAIPALRAASRDRGVDMDTRVELAMLLKDIAGHL